MVNGKIIKTNCKVLYTNMKLSTIELAMLKKANYRGVNINADVLRQKMQKLKSTKGAGGKFIQDV